MTAHGSNYSYRSVILSTALPSLQKNTNSIKMYAITDKLSSVALKKILNSESYRVLSSVLDSNGLLITNNNRNIINEQIYFLGVMRFFLKRLKKYIKYGFGARYNDLEVEPLSAFEITGEILQFLYQNPDGSSRNKEPENPILIFENFKTSTIRFQTFLGFKIKTDKMHVPIAGSNFGFLFGLGLEFPDYRILNKLNPTASMRWAHLYFSSILLLSEYSAIANFYNSKSTLYVDENLSRDGIISLFTKKEHNLTINSFLLDEIYSSHRRHKQFLDTTFDTVISQQFNFESRLNNVLKGITIRS